MNISKAYLGKMFNFLNLNSTPRVVLIERVEDYAIDHDVRYDSLVIFIWISPKSSFLS